MAQKQQQSSLCFTDGIMPPEEVGVGITIPEVQVNGCAEEGLCYEETL